MMRPEEVKARIARVGIFAGFLGTQPYNVQRRLARRVEELGFGALWYGEAFAREALVQGALLLGATDRLPVASGIASIYARDAYATAFGAKALAEAFDDRFLLGLGVSHGPLVERRGHEYEKPVAAMARYLDALDQAEASWRGPAAPTVPRVLAALRPAMLSLAASRTAGAMPYFVDVSHTGRARSILGEHPLLAPEIGVALASDRVRARRIGDRYTTVYLRLPNYVNNLRWLGWAEADLEGPGSDALFDAVVAWGDSEAIADRVQEHLSAGADHVVLNVQAEQAEGYEEALDAIADTLRRRSLVWLRHAERAQAFGVKS